jgi:divalent metal cation (Fe/Co/Zn/Cd) transporter
VVVAIVLGIETKSLLLGEGARPDDVKAISRAIEASPKVTGLIHMKTLFVGPEELLVAAKVGFIAASKLSDVASEIDAIEQRIRTAVPVARVIYIEPDVVRVSVKNAPSTETIVVRGRD